MDMIGSIISQITLMVFGGEKLAETTANIVHAQSNVDWYR